MLLIANLPQMAEYTHDSIAQTADGRLASTTPDNPLVTDIRCRVTAAKRMQRRDELGLDGDEGFSIFASSEKFSDSGVTPRVGGLLVVDNVTYVVRQVYAPRSGLGSVNHYEFETTVVQDDNDHGP